MGRLVKAWLVFRKGWRGRGTRQGTGEAWMRAAMLAGVGYFPVIGQILLTFDILRAAQRVPWMVSWILLVWAFPFLGPFLYLLLGPRRPSRIGQAL